MYRNEAFRAPPPFWYSYAACVLNQENRKLLECVQQRCAAPYFTNSIDKGKSLATASRIKDVLMYKIEVINLSGTDYAKLQEFRRRLWRVRRSGMWVAIDLRAVFKVLVFFQAVGRWSGLAIWVRWSDFANDRSCLCLFHYCRKFFEYLL